MMKVKTFFILLASLLLITGCTQKEEDSKQPSEKPKTTTNSEQKYPLTGISTNEDIDRRAIAVTINNHPKARPQTGLADADIVYELLAEANITRFLAVYQSTWPEEVGPIRSARDYYIELAKGLDCIYVCHGNSPDAKTMLANNYIEALNGLKYDGTLFTRSQDRKAPHNSYITFANIEKGAEQNSFDLTGAPEPFSFLSEEKAEKLAGDEVLSVRVSYGNSSDNTSYEYDEEAEKYKRFSDGEQTVEAEVQTPILLDNLLIIEAPHKVIDNEGRRNIDLTAGGKGYLLQKGKVNKIQWVNKNGRIVPMIDGTEAGLITGKTWVNVVPADPGLEATVTLNAKE